MKSAEKWGTSYPMRSLVREIQRDVLCEVVSWLSEEAGYHHEDKAVSDALLLAAKKFEDRKWEIP